MPYIEITQEQVSELFELDKRKKLADAEYAEVALADLKTWGEFAQQQRGVELQNTRLINSILRKIENGELKDVALWKS